jgi:hypothetical protein
MTDSAKKPIRPDAATKAEERQDAHVPAGADREPTPEESALAEEHSVDPKAAEHEREMAERGANQKGEGRIT